MVYVDKNWDTKDESLNFEKIQKTKYDCSRKEERQRFYDELVKYNEKVLQKKSNQKTFIMLTPKKLTLRKNLMKLCEANNII